MNGIAMDARHRRTLVEPGFRVAFALVTCLFVSWALAASLNDILIRQFRKALDLSRTESSLVQFAFYAGYFCAALPAGFLIRRLGYKRTMIAGLALYAAGALAFLPAAALRTYPLFLAALYAIAVGLAFLETAANPYVAALGTPETAAARLNLSQAFYGLGAIAGGGVGARFIFSGSDVTPESIGRMPAAQALAVRQAAADAVQAPYFVVSIAMILLATLIARTRFPQLAIGDAGAPGPLRVLRHPRLRWAVVAQFFYVGGQVSVWSFFVDYARELAPGLGDRQAALLLTASLALLTVGRFTGAAIGGRVRPAALLAAFAAANVVLCLAASVLPGGAGIGCLLVTSFFMSVMYPTIFTLGVESLGAETEFGASFLVMAIIGGALIPPATAVASDRGLGIQHAMLVPGFCFLMCLVFALAAPRLRTGEAR